jgi:polysaccharide biosynthesis/export protein
MLAMLSRAWIASLLAGVLALSLAGCKPAIVYPYDQEPDPRKGGYLIGPTDLLKIDVWKNNDLSQRVRVRPDGSITLPLIGEIQCSGLTVQELRDRVAKKLSTFLRDEGTAVTVNLLEVSSYKISVLGKVERPGTFAPRDFVTVLEAIALSGGLSRFADGDRVVIIRRDKNGAQHRIPFVYNAAATGERLDMNITLLGGDIVSVP